MANRKNVLLLLSTLFICSATYGQVVPDTLDNRRYFPLEVGNEWHYMTSIYGAHSFVSTAEDRCGYRC